MFFSSMSDSLAKLLGPPEGLSESYAAHFEKHQKPRLKLVVQTTMFLSKIFIGAFASTAALCFYFFWFFGEGLLKSRHRAAVRRLNVPTREVLKRIRAALAVRKPRF